MELVQRTMTMMETGGCITHHQDSDRFLANLIILLIEPCGGLDVETKCRLISEHLPRIAVGYLEEVSLSVTGEGVQKNILEDTFPVSPAIKTGVGCSGTGRYGYDWDGCNEESKFNPRRFYKHFSILKESTVTYT